VPPQNKPLPVEINSCRPYLSATIAAMPKLAAIVALGKIAHDSVVKTLDGKLSRFPFAHAARHEFARERAPTLTLFDSYHCSRYNTNTGVLTPAMFEAVFTDVRAHLDAARG
jgi:uracil-DNA glycosylase